MREALSGERQLAVRGNTLDHPAMREAISGERQLAVRGNTLDHPAIRGGQQPCRQAMKTLVELLVKLSGIA